MIYYSKSIIQRRGEEGVISAVNFVAWVLSSNKYVYGRGTGMPVPYETP